MMSAHRQTDLHAHFEAAVWSEKHNVGRSQRVVVRQEDASMKQASLKVGSRRAANGKVELKQVVLRSASDGQC